MQLQFKIQIKNALVLALGVINKQKKNLFKYISLHFNMSGNTLQMSGYTSSGVIVFLHWLHFVTVELQHHLLDFRKHGIIERSLPPSSNAVSHNASKCDANFVDPARDSALLQNLRDFSIPCHQVSWKFVWQVLPNPAQSDTQTNKKSNKPPWQIFIFQPWPKFPYF